MENICALNGVVLSMYYSVLHGKKQAHFRAFCTFFHIFPENPPIKRALLRPRCARAQKRMRTARTRGKGLPPRRARRVGFGIDKAAGFA